MTKSLPTKHENRNNKKDRRYQRGKTLIIKYAIKSACFKKMNKLKKGIDMGVVVGIYRVLRFEELGRKVLASGFQIC